MKRTKKFAVVFLVVATVIGGYLWWKHYNAVNPTNYPTIWTWSKTIKVQTNEFYWDSLEKESYLEREEKFKLLKKNIPAYCWTNSVIENHGWSKEFSDRFVEKVVVEGVKEKILVIVEKSGQVSYHGPSTRPAYDHFFVTEYLKTPHTYAYAWVEENYSPDSVWSSITLHCVVVKTTPQ